MRGRFVFLTAVAAVATSCGTTGAPTTTSQTTTASQLALKVYFYRGNALVPVVVRVPDTQAVAAAALGRLFAGPPAGFTSAVPDGTQLSRIAIANGVAALDTSPAWTGMSHSAQAQIVYTLTELPEVTAVDGRPRSDFADMTPDAAIFVAEPQRDSTVSSPVHASGTADVFEGTLAVDVWSGGKLLRTQTISASSGSGTRGSWSATLDLPPGPARLEFYEPSAENGTHLHGTEIDLTVR